MKIEREIISLNKIKKNPNNPRIIKDDAYKRLLQSLKDFPDMLEIREIVVDENNVILGGNMRYVALKQMGEKKAPIKRLKGLSEKQKKEFIIKDNLNYGEWNIDQLAKWEVAEFFDEKMREILEEDLPPVFEEEATGEGNPKVKQTIPVTIGGVIGFEENDELWQRWKECEPKARKDRKFAKNVIEQMVMFYGGSLE